MNVTLHTAGMVAAALGGLVVAGNLLDSALENWGKRKKYKGQEPLAPKLDQAALDFISERLGWSQESTERRKDWTRDAISGEIVVLRESAKYKTHAKLIRVESDKIEVQMPSVKDWTKTAEQSCSGLAELLKSYFPSVETVRSSQGKFPDFIIFEMRDKSFNKFSKGILPNLADIDDSIIRHMRDYREKNKSEVYYLGELLSGDFDKQLYVDLAESPHGVFVGKSRQGKSKTVWSVLWHFLRAYPDTRLWLCDGKSSPDFDELSEYASDRRVAKKATGKEVLIELANNVQDVYREYKRRQSLFDQAKDKGLACSSIVDWRKRAETAGMEKLGRCLLVVDEMGNYLADLGVSFAEASKQENSVPYMLAEIARAGASYGCHLILISQRYTQDNIPPSVRANSWVVYHAITKADAESNIVGLPHVAEVKPFTYCPVVSGVEDRVTKEQTLIYQMPYAGDSTDQTELLRKTYEKRIHVPFNYSLIYNPGIKDFWQSDAVAIQQKFFKELSWKSESFNVLESNDGDAYKLSNVIEKNGIKYGVCFLSKTEFRDDVFFELDEHANIYLFLIFYVDEASKDSHKFCDNLPSDRYLIFQNRERERMIAELVDRYINGTPAPVLSTVIKRKLALAGASQQMGESRPTPPPFRGGGKAPQGVGEDDNKIAHLRTVQSIKMHKNTDEKGKALEILARDYFIAQGCKAELTSEIIARGEVQVAMDGNKYGDQGVDVLVIKPDGTRLAVQTKAYGPNSQVDNEDILKTVGGAQFWNCSVMEFWNTSVYTSNAQMAISKISNMVAYDGFALERHLRDTWPEYAQGSTHPAPTRKGRGRPKKEVKEGS